MEKVHDLSLSCWIYVNFLVIEVYPFKHQTYVLMMLDGKLSKMCHAYSVFFNRGCTGWCILMT